LLLHKVPPPNAQQELQKASLRKEMLRVAEIERGLMIAELELDGIKTHITMRKERCRLYNTPFDKKVRKALSAIRGTRDKFRNDIGSKQWTLTTRGPTNLPKNKGTANRHGLWVCRSKTDWKCPFCQQQDTRTA